MSFLTAPSTSAPACLSRARPACRPTIPATRASTATVTCWVPGSACASPVELALRSQERGLVSAHPIAIHRPGVGVIGHLDHDEGAAANRGTGARCRQLVEILDVRRVRGDDRL